MNDTVSVEGYWREGVCPDCPCHPADNPSVAIEVCPHLCCCSLGGKVIPDE